MRGDRKFILADNDTMIQEVGKEKKVPIVKLVRSNCNKCYETGIMGRTADTHKSIVCDCVLRNLEAKYDAIS